MTKEEKEKRVRREKRHNQEKIEEIVQADPTFDFMSPFKDYNNKIQLNVSGITTGKRVVFTSNFRPSMGWGECFGQAVWSIQISTTQVGKAY